jgi:chromatin remodeling complex protein RSC6
MANKKSQKVSTTATPVEETVQETVVQEKVSKKKSVSNSDETMQKKKSKKEKVVKEEVVEEEVVEEEVVEQEVVDHVVDEQTDSKKRVVPTKETILSSFDEIISMVEGEIVSLRENQTKTKGIKFLRTLNKKLKVLKNQSTRVIKQRNPSLRKNVNNNNSGFLKPVKISNEMAKFTGWNSNELRSRVDVTKYLCNYIRENNLQNPKDRRQIIADAKLSKLLNYDSKKENGEPLTYYRIQSYIKPHFIKHEVTA